MSTRYYSPNLGRFLNADAFVSTGQGLLGNNMFAYCLNNPVMFSDRTGNRPIWEGNLGGITVYSDTGTGIDTAAFKMRDVTDEINSALTTAVNDALTYRKIIQLFFGDDPLGTLCTLAHFYNLVDHEAPWDIKYQAQWENTIGTPYPGENVSVLVSGVPMTPELLGNYTYGVLGYAYGFPIEWLIGGSYYAADFPTSGNPLMNEVFIDWPMIILGYEYAKQAFGNGGEI